MGDERRIGVRKSEALPSTARIIRTKPAADSSGNRI